MTTSPGSTPARSAVFVDTSAIYAHLDAGDRAHPRAREAFEGLAAERRRLVTSSYVLHETIALLQGRAGMGAVRSFQAGVAPALVTVWIAAGVHDRAVAALLAAGARQISLTDWSSFLVMRDLGIEEAFAFDDHFRDQGFRVIPG